MIIVVVGLPIDKCEESIRDWIRRIPYPTREKLGDEYHSMSGISVVTLIRTVNTLDHSQKAEKVYSNLAELGTSSRN